MTEDPRIRAARHRLERDARAERGDPEDTAQRGPAAPTRSQLERLGMIETAIEQAIRRGDFDGLPGAGKPLAGLDDARDPDWWIRRKIETEQLRGLAPPALALRREDEELDDRLDGLRSETEVREALEDFNRRVIEARRQLVDGPPVITRTRDVDAEVRAWRARRTPTAVAVEVPAIPPEPEQASPSRSWALLQRLRDWALRRGS